MLRHLNIKTFYPHPPQQVWLVLTNPRALAAWLMENDFEPRLGHKFQFQHSTLPGLSERIDCEVIELVKPKRLSYTWQDPLMCQPSIVTWTLEPVDGGTRLQLEHKAVETLHVKSLQYRPQSWDQFTYKSTMVTQTLPLQSIPVGRYEALDSVVLNSFLHGGWDYKLNERLPQVLECITSIPPKEYLLTNHRGEPVRCAGSPRCSTWRAESAEEEMSNFLTQRE